MVRQVILIICMLAFFNIVEVQAANYSTYEGNVSSTYLDMFSKVQIPLTDDYVVFRSGQYDYILFYGELDYSNNKFSGSGTVVKISQSTNNYNNYYIYDTFTDSDFNLSTSGRVVYSSLGNYPLLHQQNYYILIVIGFLLSIILLIIVIRPVFNFVLRNRKGASCN